MMVDVEQVRSRAAEDQVVARAVACLPSLRLLATAYCDAAHRDPSDPVLNMVAFALCGFVGMVMRRNADAEREIERMEGGAK